MINELVQFLNSQDIESHYLNDEHTVLGFSTQGANFMFSYDASNDPTYISMIIPNIDRIPNPTPDILGKLFRLTASYKVGKVTIEKEENVWLIADCFVYSRSNLEALVGRLISVLLDMLNDYRQNFNENR